tara:strand:+ start:1320 stop:1562 length:243 start_codon:yes stop_codon:yes gene_type:complete
MDTVGRDCDVILPYLFSACQKSFEGGSVVEQTLNLMFLMRGSFLCCASALMHDMASRLNLARWYALLYIFVAALKVRRIL